MESRLSGLFAILANVSMRRRGRGIARIRLKNWESLEFWLMANGLTDFSIGKTVCESMIDEIKLWYEVWMKL